MWWVKYLLKQKLISKKLFSEQTTHVFSSMAFCVFEFAQTHAINRGQWNFRTKFRKDPPHKNWIACWVKEFEITGCLCAKKILGCPQTPQESEETKIATTVSGLRFPLVFFLVWVHQRQNLLPSTILCPKTCESHDST